MKAHLTPMREILLGANHKYQSEKRKRHYAKLLISIKRDEIRLRRFCPDKEPKRKKRRGEHRNVLQRRKSTAKTMFERALGNSV